MILWVELDEYQSEYETVKKAFTRMTPTKIQRVQYPIAYLRYLVQTEFLNNENIVFSEKIAYFSVKSSEINECISYNCDKRLFPEYGMTFQSLPPSFLEKNHVVVVVKNRSCSIETDKNYYPVYVVEF